MKEKWDAYLCNVNDKIASILLNLALADIAPVKEKPWLLWVWIEFNAPRSDGLSSKEEFDVLLAIEDELTSAVSKACGAVLSGTITTQGRREFYYYGRIATGFEDVIANVLRQYTNYKFEIGTREDAKWSQYFGVLYPSDEELQRMGNRNLLGVLASNGDNHTLSRDVRHWIYFRSSSLRADFIVAVQCLGYKSESEYELDAGDRKYCAEVSREQAIEQSKINEASLELFRIAKEFDGEYDGWETQVTN